MHMLPSVKTLAALIAFSAVVLPGANVVRAAECAHVQTGPVGTAVAPTCTTPGLTAGVKCLNCGFEVSAQQPLAALGHLWDDGVVTKPATTSTPGVRTLTCTRIVNGKACGEKTTVEIPVIGGSGVAKNLSPADTTVTIPSAAQIALMSAHVVDNATAATALSKLGTVTPQAVKLSWQGTDGKCTVTVTRKPDVNEPTAKVFGTWTTSSGSVNVYNLEIGRTYEWSVKSSAGTATATFRTADQGPRIINAGSVGNTRDIGGWRGWHGRRIRQGHIIRSEQINHHGSGDAGASAVSADAFATFNDLLGIKTDVDLRFDTEWAGMTKSPLDRDRNPPLVDWVKIAHFQQYAPPSDTDYKVLFAPAIDVSRHPIDVHCAGGKDRAGTYIAFVEMLLGMSEEDVWRDYLLSGTRDDRMEGMMTGFKQLYLGDTLMEKAERVFMEMGFTKAELDAFREAMLEPEDGTHWHDFGEWTYTVEPTCTKAGKRQHTCRNAGCPFAGGVEVENVPALGHDWNAFSVTKAPTTGAAGTATHTCRRCGGNESATLAKLSAAGTPGAADTGSASYTWAGAEVGLWNNTTYWTPGSGAKCGVPNGAASVAAFAVDANCSVDGQGGTYAIGGLAINKRAKVTIANARLAGKFNLSAPSSGALTLSNVQADMGGGEFVFVDGDLIIEKGSSFSNFKFSTGKSATSPRVLVRDGNTTFNGGIAFVHGSAAKINDFVVDNANVTVTGGMTLQNARLGPNSVYPIIQVRNGGTVTAAALSCYYSVVKERTPFRLGYELPAGGFASAPIAVTGEADLQAAIIFEIDATKCGSGTYPLLTAGTLKLPTNGVNDFVLHAKTANGLKAQLALAGTTVNLVLGNGETCKHTSYTTLPAVAATCMEAGRTIGKKCNDCGLIFEGYQSVPSLGGHLWNAGSVTKDPSCSAAGERTFACTRSGCDATKTETIAKTAHNFVDGECTVCHAKEGGEDPGEDPDQPSGDDPRTSDQAVETKTLGDGSTVMIFRSTEGTLEFTKPAGVTEIQYLLVGGGGGGGASYTTVGGGGGAGGGGAGGFREGKLTVSSEELAGTVVVGKGGARGASTAEDTALATNGEGSSLTLGGQTVAVGGGTHGGGYKIRTTADPLASPAATDASSGGGGGAKGVVGTVNCAEGVFGHVGGSVDSAMIAFGGGGGGAGAPGEAATSTAGGAGGAGKTSTITGASVTYAAGGAGGSSSASAAAVAASTGNGGNGGHGAAAGTHGASGIVIIRFGGTGGGEEEPGGEDPVVPGGDDPVVPGGEDNPGSIELSAYCQSNMVLQRGKPITIWGRNTAGRVMTVAFAGKTATGTTGADGYWQVTFAEPFALSATPQAMTVSDNAGCKVTLSNILVGDVYLCGGQSNMDFLLGQDKKSVQQLCVGDDGIRFRRIGQEKTTVERPYELPANTDDNVGCDWVSTTDDAKRTYNLSSVAANFARRVRKDNPGVPLGLVVVSKGGTPIRAHIAPSAITRAGFAPGQGDGGYWNAMIAPITRASFRGAIWYQGCSDGGKTVEEYLALLKCLVGDWRARWGADFGFYCAQIAMPDSRSAVPDTGYPAPTLLPYELMNSVHVREAQRQWFEQDTGAHKGLAITCESTLVDLHPTDKAYVGERLALWALRDFYNGTANPSGPRFTGSENLGDGRVRISFAAGTAKGLTSGYRQNASVQNLGGWSARPNEQIKGFALAGSNGQWYAADTVTVDGESLIIKSSSVASPTKFHYGCWNHTVTTDDAGAIVQNLSLYNEDGLPMSPLWPTEGGTSVEPPTVCDHQGFVVTDAAVAATCTATGLTEGSHCSNCGAVIVAQQQLAALGHDWDEGEVTTEPTATTDGVKTYTCQRAGCGATKTETVPATGGGDEPEPPPVVVGEDWGYELKLASGDVVRVYTNTASAGFPWPVPSGVTKVRYLVVGGGGSGASGGVNMYGAGGGAGGLLAGDALTVSGTLRITVGAGGESVAGSRSGGSSNGNQGKDSTVFAGETELLRAYGGGYGGGYVDKARQVGGDGGSGGGGGPAGGTSASMAGGKGVEGQGVDGGASSKTDGVAGTGGGLSFVSNITGAPVTYAVGGAGGALATPGAGAAGADGTGNGGAGGSGASNASGRGGDGVVILRYSPGGGGDDPTCDHEGFVVTDAAVAATCTATGLTEGSHCSKCGTVIVAQQVTDMVPHHFEDGECTVCHAKDPALHGDDWGYERAMEDGSVLRVYTNTADTLTWQVPAEGIQLRYLVVGGGGGGGTGIADENKFGGGGGAGGFAHGWTEVAGGAMLEIAVGAGGAGATDSRAAETLAGHGGASSLALAGGAALASVEGGGAGGSYGSYANANGACGGGAGRNGKIGTGSQGGNGGPGSAGSGVGGGGGGMAGDGILLEGGAGVADDITGASVVYSAGGFGGKANRTPVAGADGTGNGGDGAAGALVGAKGGDGIVILRYVVIDATCAHAETQAVGEDRAATCEQDGARHGVQCKACGYWLEMPTVLPALGHDFDENDVCRHCGLNRIETLPENAKNLYFASYWQNHVVIQRGKPVTVWGKDTAGRTVTVYFGGQTATGVADASGVWAATFAEPFALSATPRTLTIADNVNEVRHIQDVLVGDVWLAGGQSNMDRTFVEDDGEFQSVRDFCVADEGLRFRRVARDRKTEEQSFDLPPNGGSTLGVNWATCASEETRNSVSATALNFATCLRKRHAEDGQDIPIGVVQVSFGGTAIREHIAASALAAAGYETAERYDSQVWNAMIAPLRRVNFTGVIWYQGCTDAATKTAEDYAALMKVLVADWRAHWGANLPFYATQIGFPGTSTARGIDHRPAPTLTPGEHNYAQIREGQRLWCERETGLHGLAIVCDGALEPLHPHDKRLPGERLSRWALRDVYGLDVEPRGPTFAEAVCEADGRVRVTFASGTALGLTTGVYHPATDSALGFFETTTAPVVGFALCGADGEWKEATAVIDGESVLLSADGMTDPTTFHYGSWCMTRKVDGTQYINLYNGAGLPLSPIAPQEIKASGGGEEEIANPAFIGGGDADNAALAKVKAWAAANGVTVAGINAMAFTQQAATGFWIPADEMAEKFLLNLPPSATAEELAAEKAAFRFTAITPGEEPTVFEPERGYNGEVKVLRSAAVDGTYAIDAAEADGRLFYEAVLVR